MRTFPKLDNGDSPDDLIHALDACDEQTRELIGMSQSRLKLLQSGKVATSCREYQILKIMTGAILPPCWNEFTSLQIRDGRLYLANSMRWQDGITAHELKAQAMTRANSQLIIGQATMIERLSKERNFYRKQCGYEARYGLMLWQCFGD